MPGPVPSKAELTDAYVEELHPAQQSALISWVSFTTTFTLVRIVTHSIRAGRGPFRNLSPGGTHLHHYLWGILSISGVGGVAIRGAERHRRHPATAVAYGVGMALIVDELALLLDLEDVYWAKQGRSSVDVAIGLIASGGTVLVGLPILRRLRNNRR